MELSEVLRRRRSVRAFEQRSVDPAVLDHLLDVARRAPSAGFSQGLDFLVLDQPASVARFYELTNDPAFPYEADELAVGPTVLVMAFSDPQRYLARYSQPDKIAFGLDRAEAWPVRFWDTDTAMACMVLLLTVVDAGLAAWFFGVAHGEADLRRELGVPDDRNLVGVVGLGHPAPYEAPRGSAYSLSRRPFEEMVHRNRW